MAARAQADVPVIDVTPHDGMVRYDEGIHIGYRAWLQAGTEPAFAFGHGLGYTTWELAGSRAADARPSHVTVDQHRRPGRQAGRPGVRRTPRLDCRAPGALAGRFRRRPGRRGRDVTAAHPGARASPRALGRRVGRRAGRLPLRAGASVADLPLDVEWTVEPSTLTAADSAERLRGSADARLDQIVERLDGFLAQDPDLSFQVAASTTASVLDAVGRTPPVGDSVTVPFSVTKNTIGLSVGLLIERGSSTSTRGSPTTGPSSRRASGTSPFVSCCRIRQGCPGDAGR